MKRTLIIFIFIAASLATTAQEFNLHWIAYPKADSTAQLWFRHTYVTAQRPLQANVTVASTGNFELYVNRWNVSIDVMTPFRTKGDESIKAITYDVSRYLRRDSNVVAIWYAPTTTSGDRKQISVVYSGKMPDGTSFSYTTNPQWLCQPANRTITQDGGERIDGRAHNPLWNDITIDSTNWINSIQISDNHADGYKEMGSFYPAMKITREFKPSYFDVRGDSIYYVFPQSFKGWIRVTLRNAQRGERVNIDGLEYICRGTIDEQACRKFTIKENRRVLICGDKSFKPSQLYNVEGIVISPYYHKSYQY